MGHDKDFIERIRTWLIPKLGPIAQWLSHRTGDRHYVESETHNNQFVGRVDMGEEEFEKLLDEWGFERNPIAALKHLEDKPEETEEGSWRKVGFEEHPKFQLHVILYDGSIVNNADTGEVYVYAHWEYRWDTNPRKHYAGQEGWNPAEGVRRMKDILDQNGIEYTLERPPAGGD